MTKTSYNYLIKIRPLDYYFFGGEQTFGDGKNVNYFAKTKKIPQQTSVLGLLRHLGYYKDGVEIGESFNANQLIKEHTQYGYIQQLSPLFFVEQTATEDNYYTPSVLGQKNAKAFALSSAGKHIKHWNGAAWVNSYQLNSYNAKAGWDQVLTGTKGTFKIDDIVKIFEKTGITKAQDGAEQKDGFFKQELAKLAPNWQFAVLAQLDQKQAALLPKTKILPFGAEKGLCHIELIPLAEPKTWADYFPATLWQHDFPHTELDCVVLLSDALASDKIYEHCNFAITDVLDFRNIRTSKDVKEFARFKEKRSNNNSTIDYLYKSGKFNLLRRGSLLYGKAADITALIERSAYQTIGYNHYIILPQLQN